MGEHAEPHDTDVRKGGDVANDRPVFQRVPDDADSEGAAADNGGNAPGTGPDTTSKD